MIISVKKLLFFIILTLTLIKADYFRSITNIGVDYGENRLKNNVHLNGGISIEFGKSYRNTSFNWIQI